MSRRLIFTGGVQADVTNRYTPGSGVGARSRAVRRSLVRRAANNNCCGHENVTSCGGGGGGGGSGSGSGGGGGSGGRGGSTSVDVGLWVEFDNKDLYTILKDKIIGATDANPKIKIDRLVLRLQAGDRSQAGAGEDINTSEYADFIGINNGNFYDPSGGDGSFIKLIQLVNLPSSINEIWILPYQANDSGFAPLNGKTSTELYWQDLSKAAQFINHWKTFVSQTNATIGNKIRGIVFETEGTTIEYAGTTTAITGMSSGYPVTHFNSLSSQLTWAPPVPVGGGLLWAVTGPPSISNPPAFYSPFTHFFPQYYNIGDPPAGEIDVNSQTQTNSNFTTSTLVQDYTLDSYYTRMFSVEPFDSANGKWGNDKWGSNSNPSLSKMIEHITTQHNPQGGYMLYCDAAFWKSSTLPDSILT